MSSLDNTNYRPIARYKLKDGRLISLTRRDSPLLDNDKNPPNLRKRDGSTSGAAAAPQEKRPSLPPRKSSAPATKQRGISLENVSDGRRETPPKLPPRPPIEELLQRRPSRSSTSLSDAQDVAPRRHSAISRSSSSVKSPMARQSPSPGRTTLEGSGLANKRPSEVDRTTSDAQNSRPKRPILTNRTTSDARNTPLRRQSRPSSSTPRVETPAQERSSSVSRKRSRSAQSRPSLYSTPSEGKASVQREGRKPWAGPEGDSRLPKVVEDGVERPKSSVDPKPPPVRRSSGRNVSSNKKDTPLPDAQNSEGRLPPDQPQSTQQSLSGKNAALKSKKPKTTEVSNKDKQEEAPRKELVENDRDLRAILTKDQRADLTLLVANITERMRDDIESHFDASKGLKLIKKGAGGDALENLDYDPATVDVAAYDKERKIRDEQEKELAKPESKKLKAANLKWFDEWRQVAILRVGEAVNSKEEASNHKQKAAPQITKAKPQQVQRISVPGVSNGNTGPKLGDLFPRIKTPLTKLPMAQRVLVLHSTLLLLLSLEHYNAASRVLLLYLTTSLKIGLSSLQDGEEKTAQGLLKAAKQMSAEEEATKRLKESNTSSRKWKIRLASAAGAAVIGYTGGLAAPMIAAGVGSLMSELGLGATTAAGYLGSLAGSTALVGSLFGAYGGRMTGQVMSNISAGVQDFAFLPMHGERKEHDDSVDAVTNTRRLRVIVAISGWLLEKEEVVTPWRVLKPSAEVFALRFELEALLKLGQSFDMMLQSAVYGYAQSAIVKRTVFSELIGGMMWPMALTKVARVVDNPFSLAQTRADKAGQVLADALINHVQGERPVTLVGYSLGARVICSCLTALAEQRAFGLVESAVLMGAPIASDVSTWRPMRAAVSGRVVNVYSGNDYLLAFLYRTSSLQYGVAGLVPITGLAGIENVDVTETVSGHLRYRYLVGTILQKMRFEDVDKDEVTKEVKAFHTIVEEEKKRTYLQQAGDLYENYKGKKPQPKRKGKKRLDMSDADAEKQASAMERAVVEKTRKGLMQWAVEQLYLSKPPGDKAKGKAAERKDRHSTGSKSYYQRAKEAAYLYRSGDSELKEGKEEESEQAEDTTPSQKRGYLSTAADYLPKAHIPSLRSSGKGKEDRTTIDPPRSSPGEPAVKESSNYRSYLPSFSIGGSSSRQKEGSNAEPVASADDRQEEANEGPAVSAADSQDKSQEAEGGHSSTEEGTSHSITSDTEKHGLTDEDPFITPPTKGSSAFVDAVKAAESCNRDE
ncbi:MAG: hypothetical protein Q9163_004733 [Psora crenata]